MTLKSMPERIIAARKILGLGERATLKEIYEAYHELAKIHHPDKQRSSDEQEMERINEARSIIKNYVDSYRYSFKLEDILLQNPQWRWEKSYAEDPLWGRGKISGGLT